MRERKRLTRKGKDRARTNAYLAMLHTFWAGGGGPSVSRSVEYQVVVETDPSDEYILHAQWSRTLCRLKRPTIVHIPQVSSYVGVCTPDGNKTKTCRPCAWSTQVCPASGLLPLHILGLELELRQASPASSRWRTSSSSS